jgi:hypothetical protein
MTRHIATNEGSLAALRRDASENEQLFAAIREALRMHANRRP